MNQAAREFAREYAAAVQKYLAFGAEIALRDAYETGRRALSSDVGVLEIVLAHNDTLLDALRSQAGTADAETVVARGLDCLAESLSPFEMVLRGAREFNCHLQHTLAAMCDIEAQLLQQNDALVRATANVQKERTRYQALFDFAPDGYLVTGFDGAIQEANAAAAQILQTDKEVLPGQSLLEFVAPDDRERLREKLHALHLGSVERVAEWQALLRPRGGPPVPVSLSIAAERPFYLTGSLRWMVRDVSEQKRLDRERSRWLVSRAKARAAKRFEFLAKASALLADAMDADSSLSGVASLAASLFSGWCFISVVDRGRWRSLSPATAEPAFDCLAGEFSGHCLFGSLDPDSAAAALVQTQFVAPVTAQWCDLAADSPGHAKALRQFCGRDAIILPLRIRDRLLGLLTLISARRRRFRTASRLLAEELARRCAQALENARLYQDVVSERDRAEQANVSKDEFVTILGHELRNPLTSVLAWVRILKEHPAVKADETFASGVKAIESAGRTLHRLANDCLDLSRISQGKVLSGRRPVDLNQIIVASVRGVSGAAAAREIALRVEPAAEPVLVLGDAVRLEQVAVNLLFNAIKYTDAGGAVSVRIHPDGGHAELEVRDTGIGIEPAFLEQIFQTFRQGTSAWLTSRSGLGLGLAIARGIVELHGGRIWAESQGIGHGSVFRVRLPLTTEAPDEESGGETRMCGRTAVDAGIRILLIEDSEDIRVVLKTEIENLGYSVSTAANGQEGLDMAKAYLPDLVISDIRMPSLDGYELIRAIRSLPELAATPAIALTGFGATADVERTLRAGFDACVTKPGEPGEIAALLDQLIARKQVIHQTPEAG